MAWKKRYGKMEIMVEVLNSKARIRGFANWEDMCLTIPHVQKSFIEDCILDALSKVNWQGVLR